MTTPGFIFGKGTPWTYEELQRKRQIADALASQIGSPRNVGEGLTAIGKALAARGINRRADKRDAELKGEFDRDWSQKIGGMFGGAPMGGGMASAPASSPARPVGPNEKIADDTMAALIRTGLVDRGLPEHVAQGFVTNIGDESGFDPTINEASPMVPGSRGGFGLAQWTGPRRVALEQYAASQGKPVGDMNTQLDFMVSELQGPEAKAAQSIMAAPDANAAAVAVARDFLRPAPANLERRVAEYGGGGASPVSPLDIGALAELAGSPYATPGQKAVVNALMQQQMQNLDPMRGMEMERARLELDALRNPQAKDTRTDDMREYEFARSQGYQGNFTDFQTQMRKAGASNQTVTVAGSAPPNDEALRKKLGEKEGEAWSSYLDAGAVSSGTMQDMQMMDELISMAPQGPIMGRLAGAFPGVSSAADAFASVVKRVAPTLRAPGSGSTSDIEYDGFLKSLPQLSVKQEGNRAISAMVKAKAQINMDRAAVIAEYQNGTIDVGEARRRVQEINKRSIMTPELKAILGTLAPETGGISADDDEYLRSLGLEP